MISNVLLVTLLLPILQCLALTPDELQRNFDVVKANLIARETAATTEIDNYETLLKTYVNASDAQLAADMTAASQLYSTKINQYIVQAAEEGKDIAKCVSLSEASFSKLASAALAEIEGKIKAISDNAETKLSAVTTAIESASTKIDALADEVTACSTDECAAELNSDLVQLYELAINDIDSALFKAQEYILNFAPTSLAVYVLDQSAFEASYASLLEQVEACL